MRIDIISIFPEYFGPLSVSLVGKAIESGLLDVNVHDLRDWTHDRHRTVDDTPYGGGAGMVMKPEPWGEALDAVLNGTGTLVEGFPKLVSENVSKPSLKELPKPTLIVPSPSGVLFNQTIADDLATRDHLVFACGRYEGIDHRVVEWADGPFEVLELSIGDYVLNGGEVATLAIIEAVARLIPGVIGNPESLLEESHAESSGGLLEYPIYTKPATWRGLEVPEVLLSGHHAHVAEWRHEQSLRLTESRRPDLLP
jgi:tRNA (guanine37-N1)-methyltransferase